MNQDFRSFAGYRAHLIEALEAISDEAVENIAQLVLETYRAGRWIYVIGNGGSASTASHMACDLNKGACLGVKKPLRVLSLTDNMAHFSALANDEGYDAVFTGQLRNVMQQGDLLIGISASGNSTNCVKAFEMAKERGAKTVGLLGFTGGKMEELSDVSVVAASSEYGPAEDVHLIINHAITEIMKHELEGC